MSVEMVLRGFWPQPAILQDRMRLCHPIMSRQGNEADLFVAGDLHWRPDGEGLRPVDPDDVSSDGTFWTHDRITIQPGVGVAVIGMALMEDVRAVIGSRGNVIQSFRRDDDLGCWVRLAPQEEFEMMARRLATSARRFFDGALRRAAIMHEKLSREGDAALRVLRRAPGRRNSDVAIRELAAAHVQELPDLYRRLLVVQARRLGIAEDTLDQRARRHVDSLPLPGFFAEHDAGTWCSTWKVKFQGDKDLVQKHPIFSRVLPSAKVGFPAVRSYGR